MDKRIDKWKDAPGAAPRVQGVRAAGMRQPRIPPTWDKAHSDPEWVAEWLRGYDETIRDPVVQAENSQQHEGLSFEQHIGEANPFADT